jgi:hypothetical protein
VNHERNHRENQQDVNQAACNMEHQKAAHPENREQDGDTQKGSEPHVSSETEALSSASFKSFSDGGRFGTIRRIPQNRRQEMGCSRREGASSRLSGAFDIFQDLKLLHSEVCRECARIHAL